MMGFFDFFKRNKTIQKAGVMPMDTLQWTYQCFNGGILEMDMIR